MPFTLAWLDSSEHERRRALDVIALFSQPETVDELGLGTVRDTIADFLSPGTSTIQTRARYFFFIPWIYQGLEARGTLKGSSEDAARRVELSLIDVLAESPDTRGVIGIESRKSLIRLPSELYWAGLSRLRFKLFTASRGQYHRMLDRGIREIVRDENNDIALDGPARGNWNPSLPAAPEGFPEGATLAMTPEEGEFFREQLSLHAHGSLIEFLASRGESPAGVALPWLHSDLNSMNPRLRSWLEDARCYSELMHGAQLLYNYMLAEKKGMQERLAEYAILLEQWRSTIQVRMQVFEAWEQKSFWSRLKELNPRLPPRVQVFSENWIGLVLAGRLASSEFDKPTRDLVANREQELKKGRARLFSQPHLDMWRGASNVEPLNYRWWITQRIVQDIVDGLNRKAGD